MMIAGDLVGGIAYACFPFLNRLGQLTVEPESAKA